LTPLWQRLGSLFTGIARIPGSDRNLRKSGEPENPRCCWAHIDNPTAHEGTTIVDGHNHETTIAWPAPGSEDTELGVLMELEVGHGETEVYARVQA
jgi:hypothetical protein